LGQNYETAVKEGKSAKESDQKGAAPVKRRTTVSVIDPGSHWPRLWRMCISDDELRAMQKLDKKEQKQMTPSNEDPTPKALQSRLRDLFTEMDQQRELNLSASPFEGVAFVTYEIVCTHRNEFALADFPFDFQNLKIIVRLDKKEGDPMTRTIIPTAHDKGFFVSSRVSEVVNFHLARNLDWEVTKEPMAIGGMQRLNASAVVRRNPVYYVRNYIIISFLLSTSVFSVFLAKPSGLEARSSIVFTIIVAVIAFKAAGGRKLPVVPYTTIVGSYFLTSFYVVLFVGAISFAFSTQCTSGGVLSGNSDRIVGYIGCSREPGRLYNFAWIPAYNPQTETAVGFLLSFFWILFNFVKWREIINRYNFNVTIIDKVAIGWMVWKYKGPKGMKGKFVSEKLINRSDSNKSTPAKTSWCSAFLPCFYPKKVSSTGAVEIELAGNISSPLSLPSSPKLKTSKQGKKSSPPWRQKSSASSDASNNGSTKEDDVLMLMQRADTSNNGSTKEDKAAKKGGILDHQGSDI